MTVVRKKKLKNCMQKLRTTIVMRNGKIVWKQRLHLSTAFTGILILTWNFADCPSESASNFFKIASADGNFLYEDDFDVVITLIQSRYAVV